MTARWRHLILPLVVQAVSLPNVVRGWPVIVGSTDAWLPIVGQLALVLVGGAVLAGGIAWAMARRAAR